MRKWTLVGCVIALVAVAGCYYFKAYGASSNQPDMPSFSSVEVERMALRQEVSCSGSVVSNLDVEIKCKASGEITELPCDVSDVVSKGDLLVKLDPVDEERSVRKAEVQLASAEARAAQAQQNLVIAEAELKNARVEAKATLRSAVAASQDLKEKARRMVALEDKGYASPEEVQSAEASAVQAESSVQMAGAGIDATEIREQELELIRQDIKLAEAEVELAAIELEDAQQRLTETQVYAPMSGVLTDRLVQVGQIISSPTANVSGGTSLMVLSDLSRVFVLALVDESDVGQVCDGQSATITVDAFPDLAFRGEVVRVATTGDSLSNVVTFEVKIEVLGEEKKKLLPMMTADVEILVASNENALVVPYEAIQRRGPKEFVLVAASEGQPPTPVDVETGIDDGTYVEIISGLDDGATVLVADEDGASTSSQEESRGGFPGPPPGGGPPPM